MFGGKSFYYILPAPLGDGAVVWKGHDNKPAIIRILLPSKHSSIHVRIAADYPGAVEGSHGDLDACVGSILSFFEGDTLSFSLDLLNIEQCSPFQKKVLLETIKIPRGRVVSYSYIAQNIDMKDAARAVGSALARNPLPVLIPCHRVVRADGRAGKFGGGTEMKRTLLLMEGVDVDNSGIIPTVFFR